MTEPSFQEAYLLLREEQDTAAISGAAFVGPIGARARHRAECFQRIISFLENGRHVTPETRPVRA
jgi:hypothetical protein